MLLFLHVVLALVAPVAHVDHVAMSVAVAVAVQAPSQSVRDGVYTTGQANAGKSAYIEKCASCHGAMAGATPDMAPLLNDYVFQDTWKNRSVGELFERIRMTMPQSEPGTLSPQRTAEIVAYILSANELPAGDRPLGDEVEALKQIRMDPVQP
jgi:mono/diheme cytochrome c family protein